MPKGFFGVGLAALLIVGCGTPVGSDNNSLSSNTPTSGTSSSSSNSTANNTESNNSATSSSSTTGTTTGYGVANPDRLYQLDKLDKITLKTPGGDLNLWVMDTESKRQEGMMFLHDKEVKDNEGMIFVFPTVQKGDGKYAFWMHNTILPLDIDYISREKVVINVGKGKPMNDDQVPPKGDYFYVIEVKQGASDKFGLTTGAKVAIPANLKGLP